MSFTNTFIVVVFYLMTVGLAPGNKTRTGALKVRSGISGSIVKERDIGLSGFTRTLGSLGLI